MRRYLLPTSAFLVLCVLVSLTYSQSTFKGCKAEGTAKSAKNKAQNVLKNRDDAPTEMDESVTLRELLLKANDDKFDPNTGVEVTGFVVDVTPGGKKETCNCGRKDLQDIHIDIVRRKSQASNKRQHFIVEITPRWQEDMGKDRADVKAEIKGKCVAFTGFLFYGRKGNWRKTAGKCIL